SLKIGSLGNIYDIAGNPNLLSCEVASLKTTLNVAVYNDESGTNLGCTACSGLTCGGTVGGVAGQNGTFTGDAIVQNLADLAWLKNVVNLTGSMTVDRSGLTTISGLSNLRAIGVDLTISNNASLSDVNGLNGLQSVTRNFNIQTNALTNVNGLSALTGVGGSFQIFNNALLGNVGGLTALATVGDYVNIQSNSVLANLDGLSNLTSVGAQPVNSAGYLQVSSNGALTSILGLLRPTTGKLGFLGGYLTVSNNGQLSSCQADALKAALVTAQGWNKVYTNTNNITCTSPKACAGAVCQ
ncbi:MAG TPA: hypothetical protein VGF76_13500, partial [Polyangiaceae bacterium]